MNGMAEVIAAHSGYNTLHSGDWTTTVTWHVHCEGLGCDWYEKLEGKAPAEKAFAAHVAEKLAKAGYGNVQEAKEWAFGVGYLMAETDMAAEHATGEKPERTNPYREASKSKS